MITGLGIKRRQDTLNKLQKSTSVQAALEECSAEELTGLYSILEKARGGYAIGTRRIWSGQTFVKTGKGWMKVKGKGKTKDVTEKKPSEHLDQAQTFMQRNVFDYVKNGKLDIDALATATFKRLEPKSTKTDTPTHYVELAKRLFGKKLPSKEGKGEYKKLVEATEKLKGEGRGEDKQKRKERADKGEERPKAANLNIENDPDINVDIPESPKVDSTEEINPVPEGDEAAPPAKGKGKARKITATDLSRVTKNALKSAEEVRTDNYYNEKPSAIGNVGKDILGAARHRYDTYDLDTLEKDGVAARYINKKNLFGEIDLNTDERRKNGDTDGKIFLVYSMKQLLKAAPADLDESRKMYHEFYRVFNNADANTKTAEEFHKAIEEHFSFNQGKWIDSWSFNPKKNPQYELMERSFGKKFMLLVTQRSGRTTTSNAGQVISMAKIVDKDKAEGAKQPYTLKYVMDKHFPNWDKKAVDKSLVPKKGDTVKINDEWLQKFPTRRYDESVAKKNKADIELVEGQLVTLTKEGDDLMINYRKTGDNTYLDKSRANLKRKRTLNNMLFKLKGGYNVYPNPIGDVYKFTKGKYVVKTQNPDGQIRYYHVGADGVTLEKKAEKARKTKKDVSFEPLQTVERVGGTKLPKLNAADTQKALIKDLGYRGVQYGNAMTDDEKAFHTEKTFEATHDLAMLIGSTPDKVTFKNRLALAIGARGKSRALAHYETGADVINLTRSSGAGSLAHEWMHFVDNVVARTEGGRGKSGYSSAINENRFSAIPVTSLKQLKHGDIIHDSRRGDRYYYDTNKKAPYQFVMLRKGKDVPMDNQAGYAFRAHTFTGGRMELRTPTYDATAHGKLGEIASFLYKEMAPKLEGYKPYWSRREELLARGFETYLGDRMKATGTKNTYLVHPDHLLSVVYPQGETRKKANKLFDQLFQIMKDQDTLAKALSYLK